MKVVLAFDSFKGSFTSKEVATIVKEELSKKYEDLDIVSLEIGDGGEGTVDAIINALNGKKLSKAIIGPHFEEIEAFIGIKGESAFIESASVVGFKYKKAPDTPSNITTYGIGELIKYALSFGVKNIYLCLGGTTSNDGGCGMAASLGVKFIGKDEKPFIPVGKYLNDIKDIDISEIDKRLKDVNIYALSDVTNPLYGSFGASFIYARQKGAKDEEIVELDKGLINLHNIIKEKYGFDYAKAEGAGAAGGLGYGALVFLNAKVCKGIETILDLLGFNDIIKDASIIFTGEGKLDVQSLCGKVISGISKRVEMMGKKMIGIFGIIDYKDLQIPSSFVKVYEINSKHLPFEKIIKTKEKDLRQVVRSIKL